MRFVSVRHARPSAARKHVHRPAHVDLPVMAHVELEAMSDEDAAIDAFLRELGEDPFDVWARLCVPHASPEREPSSGRIRRVGKPRGAIRRRATARG